MGETSNPGRQSTAQKYQSLFPTDGGDTRQQPLLFLLLRWHEYSQTPFSASNRDHLILEQQNALGSMHNIAITEKAQPFYSSRHLGTVKLSLQECTPMSAALEVVQMQIHYQSCWWRCKNYVQAHRDCLPALQVETRGWEPRANKSVGLTPR